MALLERVATLLRANVGELLHRAQDPETQLEHLLRDMENQLLQVKTQVAMAMADGHQLQQRAAAEAEAATRWQTRAKTAAAQGKTTEAHTAVRRVMAHEAVLKEVRAALREQIAESEALRGSYGRLEAKLHDTRGRATLLVSQRRRAWMERLASEAALHAEQKPRAKTAQEAAGAMAEEVRLQGARSRVMRALAYSPGQQEQRVEQEVNDRMQALLDEVQAAQRRKA